jgi:hypothetical protein
MTRQWFYLGLSERFVLGKVVFDEVEKYMRSSTLLFAAIPTVALVTLAQSGRAVAASLTIGQNFTGLTIRESRAIPADSFGAVGLHHIIQVANGGFSIYDKLGNVLSRSSLDQFFASSGLPTINAANNFDARVIYDPTSQRWFASAADRTDANGIGQTFPLGNRVVLAVSKSADPTQGWTGFALPSSNPANPQFADAPTLGVDADGVHIGVKLFDSQLANLESTLISIPKADLIGQNPTIANGQGIVGVPRINYGALVVPVTDFYNPADGKVDFLSQFTSDQLIRSSLNNNGELSNPTNIKVNELARPLPSLQPNRTRTLETGDNSLGGSVVRVGNSIWAVNTSVDKANSRNVLRWYEIDATTNKVRQQGEIGDTNHDYFYPSLAVNQQGNVVIGFNRSGAKEFISSYAIAGSTKNGKTTFGDALLLKAGEANYFRDFGQGRNRWGDYSSTVIDPSDPLSFWTFQQVAGNNNEWFTQVSQVRIVGNIAKTPEPPIGFGLLGISVLAVTKRQKRMQ